MAVLITGAAGFLGTALTQRFIDEGYSVLATDFADSGPAVRDETQTRVEYIKADIRDAASIQSLVERAGASDPVIHLAGILTAGCDRDPELAIDVNVKGLLNVLAPVSKARGRRVVFSSTIGVYGRGLPQPINETMPIEPDGWYGLTKYTGEQTGLLYARRYSVDFRAVRLAAVTGPGRKAGSGSASLFTSYIPEKAARGESYEIEVTEDTAYPVVYIKDAVNAIYTAATADRAPGRIYNIASGRIIVNRMVEAVKKRIPNAQFTYNPIEDIMAVVEGYKEWQIDCTLAKNELGWSPEFSVDGMVTDIIDSIRTGPKHGDD